jgi:hypothetical protein
LLNALHADCHGRAVNATAVPGDGPRGPRQSKES